MLKLAPYLAIGWVLGTYFQLQQENIWEVQTILAVAALSLALFMCAWALTQLSQAKKLNSRFRYQALRGLQLFCLLLASGAFAMSLINLRCLLQDHRQLVREIEGQDIRVTGMVASLPVQNAMGVRFNFEIKSASHLDTKLPIPLPAWVELSWYDREGGGLGGVLAWADLHPGDTWQFVVRFKAAHGLRNPGGFDQELWLWERGVMATGVVRSGKRDAAPQKLSASWLYPISQARQFIRSRIAMSLA
jgi:competence protein ComEC